jgi:hypothetical protein
VVCCGGTGHPAAEGEGKGDGIGRIRPRNWMLTHGLKRNNDVNVGSEAVRERNGTRIPPLRDLQSHLRSLGIRHLMYTTLHYHNHRRSIKASTTPTGIHTLFLVVDNSEQSI